MKRRFAVATGLAALALAGCASDDYGQAREARFDRPYRGGAAGVSDVRSEPAGDAGLAWGVGLLVQVLGAVFDGPGR